MERMNIFNIFLYGGIAACDDFLWGTFILNIRLIYLMASGFFFSLSCNAVKTKSASRMIRHSTYSIEKTVYQM